MKLITPLELLQKLEEAYTMNRWNRIRSLWGGWFTGTFGLTKPNNITHRGMCFALTYILRESGDWEVGEEVKSLLIKEYQIQYKHNPREYWFPEGNVTPRLKLIKQTISRLKSKS